MTSATPLLTEALELIRYEILKHLDAADFLVSRNDSLESDEDLSAVVDLVDDLVRVIKEVLDLHRESGDSEAYLSTLETVYRMMKDPKRMFGKLQERFQFY
jgi:hypothetical protein